MKEREKKENITRHKKMKKCASNDALSKPSQETSLCFRQPGKNRMMLRYASVCCESHSEKERERNDHSRFLALAMQQNPAVSENYWGARMDVDRNSIAR